MNKTTGKSPSWNFLGNYARTLICVAHNPEHGYATLRSEAELANAQPFASCPPGISHCTVRSLLATVLAKAQDGSEPSREDAERSEDLGAH